ncbi:metal ABC transporter ATP-binding protein [Rhodophyticola sp. CCM32]|uniref:metal ABC transporter ATP-binding protein n=1 Tax=Rhodophyticola sp. CCM32 TaxID=2916397 RepID=UPI00107F7C56|nr:metal ABC transporter ATP-binding protein [Rhodophyticola sp. CCM32]QBX99357.1 metal ABC transporter ATP-binding protein [Rhodophyticola sp. CCM32]
MSLVETRNLNLRFGHSLVLKDLNFTISPGEIVTLVGPNGSGKTSFLKILIGVLEPSTGTIRRDPKLKIGYVPQQLHIDRTLPLTVSRFLSLPRRHSVKTMRTALDDAGAKNLLSRQMTDLSGGQRQRVLLARALLNDPNLLILDEATQGLDQPGSAAFYRLIERVRRDFGCAVLMVSHELHVVMSASDRVVCLNGHICCEGKPETVASAPAYRALFGSGTQGALALYRHQHTHHHDHGLPQENTP